LLSDAPLIAIRILRGVTVRILDVRCHDRVLAYLLMPDVPGDCPLGTHRQKDGGLDAGHPLDAGPPSDAGRSMDAGNDLDTQPGS